MDQKTNDPDIGRSVPHGSHHAHEEKHSVHEAGHHATHGQAASRHVTNGSSSHHGASEAGSKVFSPIIVLLLVLTSVFMIVNQVQIATLGEVLGAPIPMVSAISSSFGSGSATLSKGDLSSVDVNELKSSAHTVLAVFPVKDINSQQDAIDIMFPKGTPDYGAALGVSYDDPVTSLDVLANMYPGLKAEVSKNNPEAFARFIALGTKPVGISCEYCCGIGPIGMDKKGDSTCGCQHNPALLTVALYLTAYTDLNDGEILLEVMRWKTLFFPKNMIELGLSVAGKDASSIASLPGMVGGC